MQNDTIAPVVKVKSLAEKAILISINIGVFSVNKKDKKKTEEIAVVEGSNKQFARVVKSLLRNKGTQEVLSFAQKARLDFKKKTLPWGNDDGWRIAKITTYPVVKSEVEESRRKFYELVDAACAEYQDIIDGDFKFERSSDGLGGMFNRADYPSVHAFRSAFYFNIVVDAVKSSDFRTNSLSNEEIVEINNSIQERINDAIKGAEMDVLNRINEKLSHLSSRLADSEKNFHTSNITNLCEVLQEAKELNINDNEKLTEVISAIESKICGLNAEEIRESGTARFDAMEKTKSAIAAISATMEDFSF